MNLNSEPFELIKNGSKTIELRLNDEKRRLLNVGDEILFTNRDTNEKLLTDIIELHKYDSFESLYKNFDKILTNSFLGFIIKHSCKTMLHNSVLH